MTSSGNITGIRVIPDRSLGAIDRDEFVKASSDFNGMTERIDALVTDQRQLLADVSHALRFPLAQLSVALGYAGLVHSAKYSDSFGGPGQKGLQARENL